MIKRCKVCFKWINSKATKCKHCHSSVGDNNKAQEDEFINYINNGFSLIERECALFDAKIDKMVGSICLHHEYSEEDLTHSSHIENIKSIAEKMGSDIFNWEVKGLISHGVKKYYEDKISILKQKMNYMMERLKFRRRTPWDNVSELLLTSYYFIMNIGFYHFRNFVFSNMQYNSRTRNPFNFFTQAADFFYDFMNNNMPENNFNDEATYFNRKNKRA
jgi:hypothetical protein